MSLLDELDTINRRLETLRMYETRLQRLFFMPKTRERMLARIGKKWRKLTVERSHVLDLIAGRPEENAKYRERQKPQKKPASPYPHQHVLDAAAEVARMLDTERRAKATYQAAVWYYKGGEWKGEGIKVEEVTAMLDHLKQSATTAIAERALKQQLFEQRVQVAMLFDPAHVVAREQILEAAKERHRKATPRNNEPTDFERWHAFKTRSKAVARGVPEEDLEHEPDHAPQRRR